MDDPTYRSLMAAILKNPLEFHKSDELIGQLPAILEKTSRPLGLIQGGFDFNDDQNDFLNILATSHDPDNHTLDSITTSPASSDQAHELDQGSSETSPPRSPSRKAVRKRNPDPIVRRAQNRAAQRRYRERKEQELESLRKQLGAIHSKYYQLAQLYLERTTELSHLVQAVSQKADAYSGTEVGYQAPSPTNHQDDFPTPASIYEREESTNTLGIEMPKTNGSGGEGQIYEYIDADLYPLSEIALEIDFPLNILDSIGSV
ncbi:hypothetical protein FQN55_006227 [Onygenales sp. PD_40]|nr:hypothetical protein FQN55_006227 [Onygenales sp. PD_40]KAK2804975.1 hypothetical protein FQN51_001068 [Onygenales sp. PD_10]